MMREIIPADELLSKAYAIGQYYGFTPLSQLTMKTRGAPRAKPVSLEILNTFALDPIAETLTSFLKQCRNASLVPTPRQPIFIWHTNITPGRPALKKAIIQFH